MTNGREIEVGLAGGAVVRTEIVGDGPAVVLLHGFTGDASTMRELTERLATDHTVVVPDLMGHGGSLSPIAADYTVHAMASQVVSVLDELGLEHVDLMGYSMGGRVALTMACANPSRLRSLALIGASAGLATQSERIDRVAADEALAQSLERDGLAVFVDRWMANPLFATQARLGSDRLAASREQRLHNDGSELARSLRNAGTGTMQPLHERLPTCLVPTRLIVGAEDEKFTGIAEELERCLPVAEVVVVREAGHAAHLEQPDAVIAAWRAPMPGSPVAVQSISLPLVAALKTARGEFSRRESLLLRLSSASAVGWGDASPLPGWSEENLDDCREVLQAMVGPLTEALGEGSLGWSGAAAFIEQCGENQSIDRVPAARAALVGAVLDLVAQHEEVPLHVLLRERLLDTETVDRSPTLALHALVADSDPGAVTAAVRALVAEGFATIKLKVGAGDVATDIARVAAARAAAPSVVLRLDANGAFDPRAAVDFLTAVEPQRIALCEEPTRGIEAIAAVGAEAPVAVAVDESARTLADLDRVWAHAHEIAAVVIKPQALGGPDRALVAIARAKEVGIAPIVTSMLDCGVGLAHAAHVAAAAGVEHAHGLATAGVLAQDVADASAALPVADGQMSFAAAMDPGRFGFGLGLGVVSPSLHRSP